MRALSSAIGCLCPAILLTGCLVRESRYQQAVQREDLAHQEAQRAHEETQHAREDAQRAHEETQHAREEIESLRAQLVSTQSLVQARETKANLLSATIQSLQGRLDDSTALQQQLEKMMARMGKDMRLMLQDKGAPQQALEDAKARLAELRAQQAAAEARNDAMAFFVGQLRASPETQPITVKTRQGETALLIPEALLFEPGHAELKRSSDRLLYLLARVLLSSPDWRFRIVGYTPISADKLQSKAVFDLAALRACFVANRLVSLGLAPSSLSVASRIDAAPVPQAAQPVAPAVQPAAAMQPAAEPAAVQPVAEPAAPVENVGIAIELAPAATQTAAAAGVSAAPNKHRSKERKR